MWYNAAMKIEGFYDKYKAVFYQFGAEKAVTLAFCELFTANCLEVRKISNPGEPAHQYRLRNGIPIHMLHKVEQIVADRLRDFRTFPGMLEEARHEVKKAYRIGGRKPVERIIQGDSQSPVETNPQFQDIMAKALEVNAIQYQVGPAGC